MSNGPPPPPGFTNLLNPAHQIEPPTTNLPGTDDAPPADLRIDPPTNPNPPTDSTHNTGPNLGDRAGTTSGRTIKYKAPAKPTAAGENRFKFDSDVAGDEWDGGYLVDDSSQPPDPATWNTTGACAIDLGGGYTLNDLIKDTNGSTGFSSHKAAVGTVPSTFFLQVTSGMTIPDKIILGRDPFKSADVDIGSEEYQKRVLLFLCVNRDMMKRSTTGLSDKHASFLALLRLNFVIAGGCVTNLQERAVYSNEYAPNRTPWSDQLQFTATKDLVDFVADTWLQYVGILRHLFVSRGHHFKTEYSTMIDRVWKATTIEAPSGVEVPSWLDILRLGLHCFAIRPINIVVTDAYYGGTLAASLSIRFFTAPAGVAPVYTAFAGLKDMKMSSWWKLFADQYESQVNDLEKLAEMVTKLGLRAHQNAKLFNWNWSTLNIDLSPVDALAPLVLAFIDNLDDQESLRGQKSLTKRGDGGAAIRRNFSMALMNEARNSRFVQDPEEFFKKQAKTV